MAETKQRTRVGLVEITGFHWTRRKRREWTKLGSLFARKKDPRAGQPDSFHFLPYSVGLLQAYAERHAARPEQLEFLLPLYKRVPVKEAVAHLAEVQVAGFSLYCWNVRLSLAVARRLKELRPRTLIVAGGPQVPDRAEDFLRANPFLDVVCHGEGEAVFLKILEAAETRDWSGIPGISYLEPDGSFVTRPKAPRLPDLEVIPSPYLAGVFEPLMEANPRESWQVIWETNRGCPFSCTFCDWGSAIASKVFQFNMDRLSGEIDWMSRKRVGFIFVADANFGILPRDLEIARYAAEAKRRTGFPLSLGVQSAKNATERVYQVQRVLHEMSTTGVTLAMQSTDTTTLENIKRANISQKSFKELQRRYNRDGVLTYTDMILGLPGETYDSLVDGVSTLIADGQHNRIQFYNCYILPNAEMAAPEYRKKYGMVTVESRMSDPHDSLGAVDDTDEFLELVIATDAMPRADWARTKAFCWMADLLYFSRLAQLPFMVLHEVYGVAYRDLVELVTGADPARYPVLAGIQAFFLDHARSIQAGGEEYCASEEWLGIRWPAPQLALIHLATQWKLEAFYRELEQALVELLESRSLEPDRPLVHEAVFFCENLQRMPFEIDDLVIELQHDLWDFYQSVLSGSPGPLVRRPSRYEIVRTRPIWLAWEDWCEDVIARFNTKAAYLYPVRATETDALPARSNSGSQIDSYVVSPRES